MSLKMRLDALQTMLQVSGEEGSSRELGRRRKRIEELGRARNEVVHGLWVRGDYGSPMILTVRARGALEHRRAGRSASAMLGLAVEIAGTAFELREMLEARGVFG